MRSPFITGRRPALLSSSSLAAGIALTLSVLTSCGSPKDVGESQSEKPATADTYHAVLTKNQSDAQITIETSPSGATVYIVNDDMTADVIGTTPVKYKCKASGSIYMFRVELEGYYERRIDVRPMPMNPGVSVQLELKKDLRWPYAPALPDAPDPGPYSMRKEGRNWTPMGGLNVPGSPAGRPEAYSATNPGDEYAPVNTPK